MYLHEILLRLYEAYINQFISNTQYSISSLLNSLGGSCFRDVEVSLHFVKERDAIDAGNYFAN